MKKILEIKWTIIYVLLIPLVNWAFSWTPIVILPDGGNWSPFSIIVGLILVFRDFAQREIGHLIFAPLLVGVAISFLMAPPGIAIASGIAFFTSEVIDWAIYTFTKRPLSQRVILSSLISAPIDSIIYLIGANSSMPGIFTLWTLATMIISKLAGAYVVYLMLKRREANVEKKPA